MWACSAVRLLRDAHREADRFAALGRHDEAWWVLSVALSESYKACPRSLAEVLRESPSPHSWKYRA
jgi:hypothetical protein